MNTILILFIAGILLWFLIPKKKVKSDDLDINGKLIWVDKGRTTKPFFNSQFNVFGKPDLMYKIQEGVLAVEYKSRDGGIYDSDIVQVLTAALSARGHGYNVIRILIKTKTTTKYIDIFCSDTALFSKIKEFVDIAKGAKMGKQQIAIPQIIKCRSCAYTRSCKYAK